MENYSTTNKSMDASVKNIFYIKSAKIIKFNSYTIYDYRIDRPNRITCVCQHFFTSTDNLGLDTKLWYFFEHSISYANQINI